jgi:hypothetical protein
MSEVKKCSKCGSTMLLKFFGKTHKGTSFKTCERCRNRGNNYKKIKKPLTMVEIYDPDNPDEPLAIIYE